MIRDGALAEPVREVTIASTLQRMLLDIQAVGADLEWLPGGSAVPSSGHRRRVARRRVTQPPTICLTRTTASISMSRSSPQINRLNSLHPASTYGRDELRRDRPPCRAATTSRSARRASGRRPAWPARPVHAPPPSCRADPAPQVQAVVPRDLTAAFGLAAMVSIISITSAYRRGETQMPSHPSPRNAARRTAASDRPPTRIGIGGRRSGHDRRAGRACKNSPSKLITSPVSSWRSTSSDSSIRRPRVRGSTPEFATSSGSSPPIPTPNVSRPGARSARSASWRATGSG